MRLIAAGLNQGNPFGLSAIGACVGLLSRKEPVAWGWDLAKSIDWTVGIALDEDSAVCRFERWQNVPWGDTLRKILDLTGNVHALVDSTGVGDPVFDDLQKGRLNFHGFKFTGPSKQQLMEGLAVAIQRTAVGFPAGPIVSELDAFEYEYTRSGVTYSAPAGMHDDCVCALALALRQKGQARAPGDYGVTI